MIGDTAHKEHVRWLGRREFMDVILEQESSREAMKGLWQVTSEDLRRIAELSSCEGVAAKMVDDIEPLVNGFLSDEFPTPTADDYLEINSEMVAAASRAAKKIRSWAAERGIVDPWFLKLIVEVLALWASDERAEDECFAPGWGAGIGPHSIPIEYSAEDGWDARHEKSFRAFKKRATTAFESWLSNKYKKLYEDSEGHLPADAEVPANKIHLSWLARYFVGMEKQVDTVENPDQSLSCTRKGISRMAKSIDLTLPNRTGNKG